MLNSRALVYDDNVANRIPEMIIELDVRVQEAVETGARKVADEAKARVRVDTGKLRDAIHVEPEKLDAYVIAGDDDVWYGHLVEHGTTKIPPRPFLVPSLDSNRSGIVKDVRDRLKGL
jgi:HK97 gp10 family phage protein